MKDFPLISVIVPIYKVERFLSQCIDSIIKQTYKNLEIILVNDGSPDKCGEICEDYAQKDNRIQVIHKKNGGLSDARNAALDIAKGEYITFIDSDDYITNDYIEYLWHILSNNNADISAVVHKSFIDGETPITTTTSRKVEVLSTNEYLSKIFYQSDVNTGAQTKLFKKELFNDIRFPKGFIYEDLLTIYRLITQSTTIVISNYMGYLYRERNESIMGSPFSELKYISAIKVINQLTNDKKQYPKKIQKAIDARITGFLFNIFLQIPIQESEKKRVITTEINKRRLSVIFNYKTRIKDKIACLISFISYSLLYKLKKLGQDRPINNQ